MDANPLVSAHEALGRGDYSAARQIYEDTLAEGRETVSFLLRQLAPLYIRERRPFRALRAAEALTFLLPESPEAWVLRAGIEERLGSIDAALASTYRAVELDPARPNIDSLLYLLGRTLSPEEYLYEAQRFSPELAQSQPHSNHRHSRLRIGYVSGDFRQHVMDRLIEPLLRFGRLDLYCYDNSERHDETSKRLQELPGVSWRNIFPMSAEAVAEQVRRDEIDVLVDLSGLTAGNRLDVFQLCPAPIQVTMCGYLLSTGMQCFNWRIADVEAQYQYSEPLWKLPAASIPLPLGENLPVTALPALRNGYITFGYVNGLRKLTPAVIAEAQRVLAAVPNSRLLVAAVGASEKETAAFVLRKFGKFQSRVMFAELGQGNAFCRLFGEIDIAIDPFPYGGCITSFDTLYHGVPILCRHGESRIGADAARLQVRLGAAAFINDDYASIAAEVTRDLDTLAALRSRLRPMLQDSKAADVGAWVAGIEDAFQQMHARHFKLQEAA